MHYGLSLHSLPPGVMAYCQTSVRIESKLGEYLGKILVYYDRDRKRFHGLVDIVLGYARSIRCN